MPQHRGSWPRRLVGGWEACRRARGAAAWPVCPPITLDPRRRTMHRGGAIDGFNQVAVVKAHHSFTPCERRPNQIGGMGQRLRFGPPWHRARALAPVLA